MQESAFAQNGEDFYAQADARSTDNNLHSDISGFAHSGRYRYNSGPKFWNLDANWDSKLPTHWTHCHVACKWAGIGSWWRGFPRQPHCGCRTVQPGNRNMDRHRKPGDSSY